MAYIFKSGNLQICFNLLASQCPVCIKLCRDFNSLSVNCFNDFTLTPILCKDVSWRKAAPCPRCSLSPNIDSIMETLRAVGHGIRPDNWLFCVFFDFWYYFKSIVSELQSLHIMFKRATESVKVVPESVLSNRGRNLLGTHNQKGLSPVGCLLGGGYLRTSLI